MSALAPPGSTLWLLGHDLRLAGRDLRAAGRGRSRTVAGVLLITVVLLHLVGFLGAPALAEAHKSWRPEALLTGSIALAGAFTLFLSKAISEATDALYQRGDLDLLLSSPLPMRRVLTTRLLAIAIIAGFLPILLVVPLVNGMVLHGYFEWTGAYPVLGSLALTASAAGAALTFGLLASVGARWTRFAARAFATLFGAISFLSTQARFILPDDVRLRLWLAARPADGVVPGGVQWWPARAVLGEPGPMLALAIVGTVAILATSSGLGQIYGAGVMTNLATARASREAGVARRFRFGVAGALLQKELRLLVRHPGIMAQVFYQFVFLVPGAAALLNVGRQAGISAGGVVFLTALMTGRMAKILAAGPFESDDAEALAHTSPVNAAAVKRAKLEAVLLGLIVVGGLPLVAIAWALPDALPAALFSCGGAAANRLWLAASRPAYLRKRGLAGRMPANTDGLLGVMIDIAWGIGGAVLSLFFK
jgi:ABC-2 type transport system permease protein